MKHGCIIFFKGCMIALIMLLSSFSTSLANTSFHKPVVFHTSDTNQYSVVKSYEQKINHLKLDSSSVITTLKKFEVELRSDGYLTATFDSINFLQEEIDVYWTVGIRYSFASINIAKADKELLSNLGYQSDRTIFRPAYFAKMMNALVRWGCNNGYPFALAKLENINLQDSLSGLKADLLFDKGKSFSLDSIIIKGNCKLYQNYFFNYLDIHTGDLFDESKINKWASRVKEIPFIAEVRPFELEYSDNTYHPVFYLQNKKASMLNGIIGFQSDNANTGKIYLTGDLKVKLMNVFGHAELIDFNWNNPQPRTQDLKIKFNYPYIFNFPFGVDADFSLFKKDTLWFEVNRQIGVQYLVNGNNAIKVFAGKKTNSLISVDAYKNQSSLPDVADMQLLNYGIGVQWQNLDYRFNPHQGYDINFTGTAGQRTIKKNIKFPSEWYDSLNLKSNQYRFDCNADYYLPLSNLSVLNIGIVASHIQGEKYFSNELIRFGGLKSLRGFNETSFSASSLLMAKLEYRVILEQNSFLFLFFNQAYYEDKSKLPLFSDKPYGLGAGINFETKAGIFSFTYAVGSLQDQALSFKAAKIHFGLVNLF